MKKTLLSMRFIFLIFVSLSFLTSSCSSVSVKNDTSQLKYSYSRLRVMDLDQMSQLMLDQAREFKKTDDLNALKEGLLICLSRPDEDSVVEKIISTIRAPLEDRDLWEAVVTELIEKSISVIRDPQQSSVDQVTYSIVLENLISELRPEFLKQYKSLGFETKMIQKIAAENTELLPAAQAERKLNLMKGSFTASNVAQKMLDKREDFLNQEKNKDKKEKVEIPD